MIEKITYSLKEAQNALAHLISNKATLNDIESAANILIESLKNEHCVFSCGNGKTVINAAKVANSTGVNVIALTGRINPELKCLSEVYICTPGGQFADRVQELHIKVLHILIEMVERHFHPENYKEV